jgi:hypothetical protein
VPALFVGGTGDTPWDSRTARDLPHKVLEVPSADHALELPDNAVVSVAVLHEVVSAMDRFIAQQVETPVPPARDRR